MNKILAAAGLLLFLAGGAQPAAGFEPLPEPPFPFTVPDMPEVSRLREMQGYLTLVESGRIRFERANFVDVFEKNRGADTLQALFFMSFLRQSGNPAVRSWFTEYAASRGLEDEQTRAILGQYGPQAAPFPRLFGLQEREVLGGRVSLELLDNDWEVSTSRGEQDDVLLRCPTAGGTYEVRARRVSGLDEAGFLAMLESTPVKQASERLFEQEVTRRGAFLFSNADRAFVELARGTDGQGRVLGVAAVYLYVRRARTAYCVEHSLSIAGDSPTLPIASRLWSQMAGVAALTGLTR